MKRELEQAIVSACRTVFGADVSTELTRPDEQFGDYATNVALQLAGKLSKKPREIAEALQKELEQALQGRAEISIAGPGFLNFKLSDVALVKALEAKPVKILSGKTIVFDYSDPNPFKPLHAGHLYTTLVGDAISRLVEHAGAKTVRTNYGGDVGLHAGKTMWAIINYLDGELPEKLSEIPEAERAAWLGARYVEGNNAYEDNEKSKTEIVAVNKRVYQLHADNDHTSSFAQIYWTCRQWSYDYFDTLYEQLQVKPFDRYIPESEIVPLGMQTVLEQLEKGVYQKSDGAVVYDGEKDGLHTRVFINSQGLPTYETKDVGLSLTKWRDYRFDQSIIITAHEQAEYMKVVIASMMHYAPEPASRTLHLTHGIVKLQGGVKMSSRKGNVVTALEILDAARQAGTETGTNPSEATILAAVKYAFAKNRIGGDIIYDPKDSIALEGNSGPYLQYAHARARSIIAKAEPPRHSGPDPESSEKVIAAGDASSVLGSSLRGNDDVALEPGERSLVRKISEYSEVVEKATAELLPHYICTYLYELAQVFNSFYEHNRVIGNEREAVRLRLVAQYADTLKDGLELLGITAPDTM